MTRLDVFFRSHCAQLLACRLAGFRDIDCFAQDQVHDLSVLVTCGIIFDAHDHAVANHGLFREFKLAGFRHRAHLTKKRVEAFVCFLHALTEEFTLIVNFMNVPKHKLRVSVLSKDFIDDIVWHKDVLVFYTLQIRTNLS